MQPLCKNVSHCLSRHLNLLIITQQFSCILLNILNVFGSTHTPWSLSMHDILRANIQTWTGVKSVSSELSLLHHTHTVDTTQQEACILEPHIPRGINHEWMKPDKIVPSIMLCVKCSKTQVKAKLQVVPHRLNQI